MGRGRPGKGLGHVDGLEGPEATKARMRLIVQTLAGEVTVKEAAKTLGISASRFAALRQEVMQDWLDVMAPGTPGRPPKTEEPIEPSEVEALRKQVKELILDLQVAHARTELAITMPHVLKDVKEAEAEKGGPGKKRRTRKRWFGDSRSDTQGG